MVANALQIAFNAIGIGSAIDHEKLMVPANQRSYAWEESHVQTLFQDLSSAIQSDNPTYFLGTIVLTQGPGDRLEVADGQQRLATTTILIAAIRDFLDGGGPQEKQTSNKYTAQFLLDYDEFSGEYAPKLQLNYEDNDFFLKYVLLLPDDSRRLNATSSSFSHKRIQKAAEIAKVHVGNIVAQFNKPDRPKHLYQWIKFLRESAVVISIRVPDHINAFTMFETLNDRGLRASQTDILKNALFSLAKDRLHEVQLRWSSMTGVIESVGDDDMLLTYIRHYWIMRNGPTQERDLALRVKQQVTTKQQAVDFVFALDDLAADYTALVAPLEHPGWTNLDKQSRAYIYVLTRVLTIEQMRPLLLAMIRRFEPTELKKMLKVLVSWSVRFLIAGAGGGGPLDRNYGQRAKEVMDGSTTNARQIISKTGPDLLRSDKDFKQAFAQHRVTRTALGRYFLRSLELQAQGDANPDLGGVLEDTMEFNLEHIMPLRPSEGWAIETEAVQIYGKRLGNMVLLNPNMNVRVGNKPFAEKAPVFATSPSLLTQDVGAYAEWGSKEIDQRQEKLAEFAVKTWVS